MRVPIFMYVATQLNSVLQKTIPLETQVMIMHMCVCVNIAQVLDLVVRECRQFFDVEVADAATAIDKLCVEGILMRRQQVFSSDPASKSSSSSTLGGASSTPSSMGDLTEVALVPPEATAQEMDQSTLSQVLAKLQDTSSVTGKNLFHLLLLKLTPQQQLHDLVPGAEDSTATLASSLSASSTSKVPEKAQTIDLPSFENGLLRLVLNRKVTLPQSFLRATTSDALVTAPAPAAAAGGAFGTQQPAAASGAFGAQLAGNTFGAARGAFGVKPAGNIFGAPPAAASGAFGAPAGGGAFGAQPAGGGGFGAPAAANSAFVAQPAAKAFGALATGGGFGTQQPTATNDAFAGGFKAPAAGGAIGAQPAAGAVNVFGGQQPAAGGGFGAPAAGGAFNLGVFGSPTKAAGATAAPAFNLIGFASGALVANALAERAAPGSTSEKGIPLGALVASLMGATADAYALELDALLGQVRNISVLL